MSDGLRNRFPWRYTKLNSNTDKYTSKWNSKTSNHADEYELDEYNEPIRETETAADETELFNINEPEAAGGLIDVINTEPTNNIAIAEVGDGVATGIADAGIGATEIAAGGVATAGLGLLGYLGFKVATDKHEDPLNSKEENIAPTIGTDSGPQQSYDKYVSKLYKSIEDQMEDAIELYDAASDDEERDSIIQKYNSYLQSLQKNQQKEENTYAEFGINDTPEREWREDNQLVEEFDKRIEYYINHWQQVEQHLQSLRTPTKTDFDKNIIHTSSPLDEAAGPSDPKKAKIDNQGVKRKLDNETPELSDKRPKEAEELPVATSITTAGGGPSISNSNEPMQLETPEGRAPNQGGSVQGESGQRKKQTPRGRIFGLLQCR